MCDGDVPDSSRHVGANQVELDVPPLVGPGVEAAPAWCRPKRWPPWPAPPMSAPQTHVPSATPSVRACHTPAREDLLGRTPSSTCSSSVPQSRRPMAAPVDSPTCMPTPAIPAWKRA
eukprot:2626159-Rhodomonas_salina.1